MDITLDNVLTILDEHYNSVKVLEPGAEPGAIPITDGR